MPPLRLRSDLGETRLLHQSAESGLIGKVLHRVVQISISGAVPGDALADPGQNPQEVELEEPVEEWKGGP